MGVAAARKTLHSLGQTRGGIRTPDDVKSRCDIDEATGCWLWRGAMSNPAEGTAIPVAYEPERGAVVSVRRLVRDLLKLPAQPRVWSTCGELRCVCPEHARAGTVRDWGAWLRETGKWKALPAKLAACRKNPRTRHLTDDDVRAIRKMKPMAASKAYGISYDSAWKIQRRESWAHVHDAGQVLITADTKVTIHRLPQAPLPPQFVDPAKCRRWAALVAERIAA